VGAVVATLTLVPSCAIVPNPSPEELATADYGPVPTKYDLMVERHIQFEYDLELSSYGREWYGPIKGYFTTCPNRECETVYGYEVHVEFTNDVHYMVLIRDGQVVRSEKCGRSSGGFPLLNLLLEGPPSC
jgi:hypothetical protein